MIIIKIRQTHKTNQQSKSEEIAHTTPNLINKSQAPSTSLLKRWDILIYNEFLEPLFSLLNTLSPF